MSGQRYVIVGAARPRAAWFARVSQWSTSSAIPADFVKCIGADDVRACLVSGRAVSAVLLDGGLPGVDRDLIDAALAAGAAPILVHATTPARNWWALGARAVLDPQFGRSELLDALASTSLQISRGEPVVHDPVTTAEHAVACGVLVAVLGSGGTGTSTVAMAAAQALASDHTFGPVVLADLCGRAEQGMLHDTRAVAPGLQELVQAHRGAQSKDDAIDAHEFCVRIAERNYDLLMGLRRRRLWSTLRPSPTIAALRCLRTTYAAVVTDCDGDLEGEDEGGSADVEERNLLSRTAVASASVVMVVGDATLKGLHSLTRMLQDVQAFGVDVGRVQPVVNRAPGSPRARAGYAAALAELCGDRSPHRREASSGPPIFIPFRNVDECIRAGALLPAAVTAPVDAALRMHLARDRDAASTTASGSRWRRVRPTAVAVEAS